MKYTLILLLSFPIFATAQIGIQTNTMGYLVMPLIDEHYHSVEFAVETTLMSNMVLKSSIYYLKKTDFSTNNSIKVRADQLKKYGIRLASKFYPHKKNHTQRIPDGFFIGPYADFMYGDRRMYQVKNGEYNLTETRKGVFISTGFNIGYTFVADQITVEPNLGIGASYVSPALLNQSEWLNFDPEIQSLSTCHLQLNFGYRF